MRISAAIAIGAAFVALSECSQHPQVSSVAYVASGDPVYTVANQPSAVDIPRLGLNLGGRTSWGAEQLMANVLCNPGFEPTVDGAIVVVHEADGSEFSDDTAWLARPAGFWRGARLSVRTGQLAGTEAQVVDSGVANGYPNFRADRPLPRLASGDVIALSLEHSGTDLPSQWWWQKPANISVSSQLRPGSNGTQSLLLSPDASGPVAAISYLDQITDRAGTLLPLHGTWEAVFWAKGSPGSQLTVQLRRLNAAPVLREVVQPGAGWNEYRFQFQPVDSGPPAGLEFRLEAESVGTQVWIDDVSLAAVNPDPSGFRTEVVQTLQQLRPGYLRDWQGQLGDSFSNRTATLDARRPTRYRPGDETAFAYSLPEFVELCHEIDAQPWIVLPTTFRDDEWTAAGIWLEDVLTRYGFREILIEFGNENWNSLFRPAGIMDAGRMGEAAERGFHLLKAAAGNDPRIRTAIGGQFVNPGGIPPAIASAPDAAAVSIAPYYARVVGTNDTERTLFAEDSASLDGYSAVAKQSQRQVAVYEMNAHALDGNATPDSVSALVTSQAAGGAILYHALRSMDRGDYRQCLYSLAGFDTYRTDGKLVRLFGLTRDLAQAGDLRPTGVALQLANLVVGGSSFDVSPPAATAGSASPLVAMRAFNGPNGWSILAASSSPTPVDVTVRFPANTGGIPNTLSQLGGQSPTANNENGMQVTIARGSLVATGNRIQFQLAPYSAAAAYTVPGGVSDRNRVHNPQTPH